MSQTVRARIAALVAENAALKAQVEWQQAMLDKYDADNTELIQENAALKVQVKRLSAPISKEEWKTREGNPRATASREIVDALITARLTEKGEPG